MRRFARRLLPILILGTLFIDASGLRIDEDPPEDAEAAQLEDQVPAQQQVQAPPVQQAGVAADADTSGAVNLPAADPAPVLEEVRHVRHAIETRLRNNEDPLEDVEDAQLDHLEELSSLRFSWGRRLPRGGDSTAATTPGAVQPTLQRQALQDKPDRLGDAAAARVLGGGIGLDEEVRDIAAGLPFLYGKEVQDDAVDVASKIACATDAADIGETSNKSARGVAIKVAEMIAQQSEKSSINAADVPVLRKKLGVSKQHKVEKMRKAGAQLEAQLNSSQQKLNSSSSDAKEEARAKEKEAGEKRALPKQAEAAEKMAKAQAKSEEAAIVSDALDELAKQDAGPKKAAAASQEAATEKAVEKAMQDAMQQGQLEDAAQQSMPDAAQQSMQETPQGKSQERGEAAQGSAAAGSSSDEASPADDVQRQIDEKVEKIKKTGEQTEAQLESSQQKLNSSSPDAKEEDAILSDASE